MSNPIPNGGPLDSKKKLPLGANVRGALASNVTEPLTVSPRCTGIPTNAVLRSDTVTLNVKSNVIGSALAIEALHIKDAPRKVIRTINRRIEPPDRAELRTG